MEFDHISLRDLLGAFHPDGASRGVFVFFRGYMDESYDGQRKVFCLSCLIGEGNQWIRLARDWRDCLNATNEKLVAQGRRPLSRYHASDCNRNAGDFADWGSEENRAFVLGLFAILNRSHLHAVSISAEWESLREFVPARVKEKMAYCFLLIPFLHQLGKKAAAINPAKRLALFHDRTNFDGAIAHVFSVARDDPKFEHASRFVNLAPLCWQDCVALQPADMFAFEAMRECLRIQQSPSRKPRRSFEAMRAFPNVPWRHVNVGKAGLMRLDAKIREEIQFAVDEY